MPIGWARWISLDRRKGEGEDKDETVEEEVGSEGRCESK